MAYEQIPGATITSLPKPDEIATMSPTDLSRKIARLCSTDTLIQGEAVFFVNEFLAHAALRLAKAHLETIDGI